jgi:hypothetical protein
MEETRGSPMTLSCVAMLLTLPLQKKMKSASLVDQGGHRLLAFSSQDPSPAGQQRAHSGLVHSGGVEVTLDPSNRKQVTADW